MLKAAKYKLQCPCLHVLLVVHNKSNNQSWIPNPKFADKYLAEGQGEFTFELYVVYFIPTGYKYWLPFCPSTFDPDQQLVITWIRTMLVFWLLFFFSSKTCNIKSPYFRIEVNQWGNTSYVKKQFCSYLHLPYNHTLTATVGKEL